MQPVGVKKQLKRRYSLLSSIDTKLRTWWELWIARYSSAAGNDLRHAEHVSAHQLTARDDNSGRHPSAGTKV